MAAALPVCRRSFVFAAQMQAQQAPAAAAPVAAPANDLLSQLNQLAQLHATGVLSDSEFAAAKQKLLSAG